MPRFCTQHFLLACALSIGTALPGRAQLSSSPAIYTDSLTNSWQNWSWCGVDFTARDAARSSASGINVTFTGAWQGFYLHHEAFSTRGLDRLTFWINGGAASGRDLTISGVVANNGQPAIFLNKYIEGGAIAANTWRKVSVPLLDLGLKDVSACTGFWIMNGGAGVPALYLDDIAFTVASGPPPTASPVTLAIDAKANLHAINPNIYGVAYATTDVLRDLNVPLNRMGGNNTSRYNWQLNADNKGSDWYFQSIGDPSAVPGERTDTFMKLTKAAGAQPMLTIPMVGYVAALGSNRSKLASFSVRKYGAQTGTDAQWFPDAGNGIAKSTNKPIVNNNPADANVKADSLFQQGWVRKILSAWNSAANGGLRYYILDNEPSLWHGTHRDVHPVGTKLEEIRDKTLDYAAKIKALDPDAQIVGPEEWGWSGYLFSGYDQQWGNTYGWSSNLPDRAAHGNQDALPWLLSELKRADAKTKRRSLDIFSVHYYPQGGEFSDNTSPDMQARRNRSTRSLWDPNYTDETWIASKVALVPRLKTWVNTCYPGLQTAITEYNWGAENHINGATTQADILGIFGREGLDMAARWAAPGTATPTYKAMKLYRNADGKGMGFGDVSVADVAPNPDTLSSFAALRSSDGALTIMIINKSLTDAAPVVLNVANFAVQVPAQVWQLTSANAITRLSDVAPSGSSLRLTVPSQSITLLALPPAPQAPKRK